MIAPFVYLVFNQFESFPIEVQLKQQDLKKELKKITAQEFTHCAHYLHDTLPTNCQGLMNIVMERGPPSWLLALPLQKRGFDLYKEVFKDTIWLASTPPSFKVCM